MTALQKVMQSYEYVFYEISDPRTKDWWLAGGPGPLLTILATYLYFCTKAGPNHMKDRKPYNLKTVVMIYNVFQIIISTYFAVMGILYVLNMPYTDRCYSVSKSEDPLTMVYVRGVALFFYVKVIELLDTVFFVLRKKDNQVTFLHLYHHTIMPLITWMGTKYAPGGQAIAEGSINGFIHMVMYTYYLISGLGPEYQKYLWWKKYLTSMQLIQFCLIVFLNVNSLSSSNCNYPKFLTIIVLTNCVAFFYMFGKFYYNSYVKRDKSSNSIKQVKSH